MKSYKEFEVWRNAVVLLREVYEVIGLLPKNEGSAFASQMRRAAQSIPFNIAEGFAKNSLMKLRRFSRIAYGSAMELEVQLTMIHTLGLITDERFKHVEPIMDLELRLLNGLISSLTRKIAEQETDSKKPRTKHEALGTPRPALMTKSIRCETIPTLTLDHGLFQRRRRLW